MTGHSGFKGSWLVTWLTHLGAEVYGLSLKSKTNPSHWELLENKKTRSDELDIRNVSDLRTFIADIKPEIVFHLAVQAIVRESVTDPLPTWSTNIIGTANIWR